jgi:glutathione S-transferase
MKLLYQTHSPYARKTLVFALEAGLADSIEVVNHETSPTARNEEVFAHNPLGKVPVLICPDGLTLFDSDVICAYLDTQHDGPRLIPVGGSARWQALQLQAFAQGLADAGIALRWETVRRPPQLRYPSLADGYARKLISSYDWLERELPAASSVHVGHIALATALSWLEFRHLPAFRLGRPRVSEWFEEFESRASMRATPLAGETHDGGPV